MGLGLDYSFAEILGGHLFKCRSDIKKGLHNEEKSGRGLARVGQIGQAH